MATSLNFDVASFSHLHDVSTVQKRNHLFDELLGGLSLWREAGRAILRDRECHKKKEWDEHHYLLYTTKY